MLAVIMTDVAVPPDTLQTMLRKAVQRSFNCISVEGHTSTSDSVLCLANGAAHQEELSGADLETFETLLGEACADLAKAIANDAEGIKHLITLDVEGLADEADARQVAKTVAESPLVKTAVFGADPNWGRIVSAAGYAGVELAEPDMSLWMEDVLLYDKGVPQEYDYAALHERLKTNHDVYIRLVCGTGPGNCRFWTCDLTYEYIRLNAEYTT